MPQGGWSCQRPRRPGGQPTGLLRRRSRSRSLSPRSSSTRTRECRLGIPTQRRAAVGPRASRAGATPRGPPNPRRAAWPVGDATTSLGDGRRIEISPISQGIVGARARRHIALEGRLILPRPPTSMSSSPRGLDGQGSSSQSIASPPVRLSSRARSAYVPRGSVAIAGSGAGAEVASPATGTTGPASQEVPRQRRRPVAASGEPQPSARYTSKVPKAPAGWAGIAHGLCQRGQPQEARPGRD